jgi:tetratricopeptide (TPR) repeat protein
LYYIFTEIPLFKINKFCIFENDQILIITELPKIIKRITMKKFTGLCLALLIVITVNAQNAKKFFKTGEDFYQAGNYKDAISQFTNAIGINPEYKEAYFMRGCAHEETSEFQKAYDDFNRALIFDPKDEVTYYHLGKNLYELGKYKEALTMLHKATSIDKKLMEAYQQKILVLLKLGQGLEAIKVGDSVLALEGSAYNYYLCGLVNETLKSDQKAEWFYLKSIKENKKYIDGYIALSNIQIGLNKVEEAMINCNEALKLDPNSRKALIARSKVFVKKVDYRNGIDDLSRAIVLNPDDQELYYTRGIYYQQFIQHQNAINDFNKVLLLNPDNADALYQRARSNEEIANYSAAIKDYQSLVKISEFDGKAQKLLKDAQARLFELNREKENPIITLVEPTPKDKFVIEVPLNKNTYKIKGFVKDKSDIAYIKINNQEVKMEKLNGQADFYSEVPVDSTGIVSISASDVYNNLEKINYTITRTEITPPKVAIMAPIASDNGEVFLDNNDPTIYIEGKVSDQSLIKSILIEGVSASFKLDELNPTFSASININNKNKFTVIATDIYGNQIPDTFKLNRDGAGILAANPMGKTWVVFIENSKYTTFASLEGPNKDVSLMKAALAKYQVSQFIHKQNMSKEQMEKFFSIELRDLIRSNRVNSLLVWYAGHGKFINETGYWIPIDASRDDEFTYFNINFLRASMQSYNTLSHTLIITDACESGPSFYTASRSISSEPSCSDWQKTRLKSSQVFSSAGYELAVDRSQFTQTFANLLRSNPNACIPIDNIVTKVSSAVSKNTQQKPKWGKITGLADEDGTFFFIAK